MKTNYLLCFVVGVLVSFGVAVAQEPAAESDPEETVEATPLAPSSIPSLANGRTC